MTLPRPHIAHRIVAAVLAVGLFVGAAPLPAPAAPAPPRVSISSAKFITTDGVIDLGVSVALPRKASRMSVRVQLFDATDALVWQRTQTKNALDAGAYLLGFNKPARDLGLGEGRYRLEARVRVDDAEPVEVSDTLLVVDARRRPTPVTIVVRVSGTPLRDADGAFIFDPSVEATPRVEAESLAALASQHPEYHLTMALPPVLLDEWLDASDGFTAVAKGARTDTSADSTASVACSATIAALRRAGSTGSLRTLAAMYAEPDLVATAKIGGAQDLRDQLAEGMRTSALLRGAAPATGSVEPTGFAVLGDVVARSSAAIIAAAGLRYAIIDPASIDPSHPASVSPGAYALGDIAAQPETFSGLVIDRAASKALSDPLGEDALLTRLFDRATDEHTQGQPVVIVTAVGTGSTSNVERLRSRLATLARIPWVRLVDTASAAGVKPLPIRALAASPPSDTKAPAGYWERVRLARQRARALAAAAGAADADALAALRNVTMAESRLWAGPDGSWPLADRGSAFARAADATAWSILSKVLVEVPAVTLSSNAGRVPVSIRNNSTKSLEVSVTAISRAVRPPRLRMSFALKPGETLKTIAVDLGPALSSRLQIVVSAGGFVIAKQTATVRASSIERPVLIGGVVLVLLLLLWYIRRNADSALSKRRERADDDEREAAELPERYRE
ncbi:MAG: hypothetical protein Q7W30_03000 [Coriobacteriia bacterium]|nr:hypothetical protein [Coriobacteriia bacterium]